MLETAERRDVSKLDIINTTFNEKKLYIVKYIYEDKHEGNIEKDEWVLACEDSSEIRKIMDLNKKQFKRYGYDIVSYSFKEVKETDNGYKIKIGGKSRYANS